jgi:hypothetical protein
MAVGAIVLAVAERRLGEARLERGPALVVLGLISVALGALFFAGSLCRGHYLTWPGYVGGFACALVGLAATRPLFARVRARLDDAAAAALPAYAELIALIFGALSIVAPPVGVIVLLLLLWLLFAGWRRGEQKYAGLRILR